MNAWHHPSNERLVSRPAVPVRKKTMTRILAAALVAALAIVAAP